MTDACTLTTEFEKLSLTASRRVGIVLDLHYLDTHCRQDHFPTWYKHADALFSKLTPADFVTAERIVYAFDGTDRANQSKYNFEHSTNRRSTSSLTRSTLHRMLREQGVELLLTPNKKSQRGHVQGVQGGVDVAITTHLFLLAGAFPHTSPISPVDCLVLVAADSDFKPCLQLLPTVAPDLHLSVVGHSKSLGRTYRDWLEQEELLFPLEAAIAALAPVTKLSTTTLPLKPNESCTEWLQRGTLSLHTTTGITCLEFPPIFSARRPLKEFLQFCQTQKEQYILLQQTRELSQQLSVATDPKTSNDDMTTVSSLSQHPKEPGNNPNNPDADTLLQVSSEQKDEDIERMLKRNEEGKEALAHLAFDVVSGTSPERLQHHRVLSPLPESVRAGEVVSQGSSTLSFNLNTDVKELPSPSQHQSGDMQSSQEPISGSCSLPVPGTFGPVTPLPLYLSLEQLWLVNALQFDDSCATVIQELILLCPQLCQLHLSGTQISPVFGAVLLHATSMAQCGTLSRSGSGTSHLSSRNSRMTPLQHNARGSTRGQKDRRVVNGRKHVYANVVNTRLAELFVHSIQHAIEHPLGPYLSKTAQHYAQTTGRCHVYQVTRDHGANHRFSSPSRQTLSPRGDQVEHKDVVTLVFKVQTPREEQLARDKSKGYSSSRGKGRGRGKGQGRGKGRGRRREKARGGARGRGEVHENQRRSPATPGGKSRKTKPKKGYG